MRGKNRFDDADEYIEVPILSKDIDEELYVTDDRFRMEDMVGSQVTRCGFCGTPARIQSDDVAVTCPSCGATIGRD